MTDNSAEDYIKSIAIEDRFISSDYEFTDIEIPDTIAAQMKSDPRFEITEVDKGEFGLDFGTMIVSFKITK